MDDAFLHHKTKRYVPPMGFFNLSGAFDDDGAVNLTRENNFLKYGNEELYYAQEAVNILDSPALLAYDILIPMLGICIIFCNALVVISSGLVLRKGRKTDSSRYP